MTQIISSRITLDAIQIDGRRCVREEHEDDLGNVYDFDYVANASDDIEARLESRAFSLNEQLNTEVSDAVG